MTKGSRITRGLIVLISLMLLASNGSTLAAGKDLKSVAPYSPALNGTFQNVVEELPILQFELIGPEMGWLATEELLYWTDSNGETWKDITPPALSLPIVKVEFVDKQLGWLVGLDPKSAPVNIAIYQTKDGGATWQDKSGALQQTVREIDQPLSAKVYSQFESDGQAWLMLKFVTGVNFSLGTMLYTADSGETWELREAQSGEPIRFIDGTRGYQLAAHAVGLLSTIDGGMTWENVNLPIAGLEPDAQIQVGLPSIAKDGRLVIPVHTYTNQELSKTYLLESLDEGKTWVGTRGALASTQPVLRGEPLLETISETGEFTQWPAVAFAPSEAGEPKTAADPIALDRLTLTSLVSKDGNSGWGLFSGGNCTGGEGDTPTTCLRGQVLATTPDGGLSWSLMQLPAEIAVLVETQPVAAAFGEALQPNATTNTTNWQLIQAQGFDTCTAVNMSKMSSWRSSSPYRVYGLYIGGSMAFCPNTVFNATSLRILFNAGWRFIPTWVGPQAPCTSFRERFSLDPAIAYNEGVTNANQAVEALKTRGMTNPDGSGSVIYYDLERFPDESACKAAARSFLRGWTTRLHETGNKSGLYATSVNLNVNQIYTIVPPPDVVWIAEWYSTFFYRNWVTVFNVDYLASTYWADHQRVYQYTGGHDETWGGVTLSVDNDVIDGVVAVPYSSDITLPVSTVKLSGTLVSGDLYKSSVTVTLSATDNVSGIKVIYYNLDNTVWNYYTTPFIVTTDQTHTLKYLAVDGVYNWENYKQTTFKIDTTAPGFPSALKWNCQFPGLKQAFCNDESFSWAAAADNLSGLQQTYIYWGTNANGTGTTLATTSFNPGPIPDKATYYLRFSTVDNVGNQSSWRTLYTLSYDTSFDKLRFLPLVSR